MKMMKYYECIRGQIITLTTFSLEAVGKKTSVGASFIHTA